MEQPGQLKPVSLRISVTDRCQLRCAYCMPPQGVPLAPREEVLRFEEIAEFAEFVHRRMGLAKARITGGEPLVRAGLTVLVEQLVRLGIPDVALTTNGQRLAEMAADLRRAGLGRVNVSLDTLNPDTYRTLTSGGDLGRTLAGIDAALKAGLRPVKLNMLVLRGVNDHEVGAAARFALDRGLVVRFLELMPIGAATARFEKWFVPSSEVRRVLSESFRLTPPPRRADGSSRDYLAEDAEGRSGTVGFISSCSEPFCRGCRRLRLTATGRLLGCLAQEKGFDVRGFLRGARPLDEAGLAGTLEAALGLKQGVRRFADGRLMVRVGG
jgi:cyclic pyranopterin phosphate synthase